MNKAPQKRVAGVGSAMGAVMFAGALLGCAPGTLPCDRSDWKEICALDGGVPNAAGGSPGGSGGTPGGMGGSTPGGMGGSAPGGMGGSGSGGDGIAARTVTGCDEYKTVKDFDKFFEMRCGTGITCHVNAGFGDFKAPDLYKRLPTMMVQFQCKGTKMWDPDDPKKSLMFVRTTADAKCLDDPTKAAGARMPMTPQMALTDAESACLEGYLKAIKP